MDVDAVGIHQKKFKCHDCSKKGHFGPECHTKAWVAQGGAGGGAFSQIQQPPQRQPKRKSNCE
eukprot:10031719-Lingulodinium_polyedra.AAC.1